MLLLNLIFGKIRLRILFRSKIERKLWFSRYYFEILSNRSAKFITLIKPETRSIKPETQNECLWKTRPATRESRTHCNPTKKPKNAKKPQQLYKKRIFWFFGKLLDFCPKYLQPRNYVILLKAFHPQEDICLKSQIKLPRFGAILNTDSVLALLDPRLFHSKKSI